MDAETRAELARMETRLMRAITERTRNIPSQWPVPPPPFRQVQVIGGNVLNAVQCIKYVAADPTLTRAYDPDVDTTYPDGLGYGWLWVNGYRESRVLIRHEFGGSTSPLSGQQQVGGWLYPVRTTKILTATVGQQTLTMTAYCVMWTP